MSVGGGGGGGRRTSGGGGGATWNAGNPAVKRILKEAKEFRQSPCREFVAEPLESSVFEWVFTMRGPDNSEFEYGFYRGRIILQANYPFAPPDIMMLTPNGRFELNKKICLSISSYHPENWHPTWGVRTVLHALREFMATPGNNGIGAIEYPKDKRRQLAVESVKFICPILNIPIQRDVDLMNASPPSVSSKPNLSPEDSLAANLIPSTSTTTTATTTATATATTTSRSSEEGDAAFARSAAEAIPEHYVSSNDSDTSNSTMEDRNPTPTPPPPLRVTTGEGSPTTAVVETPPRRPLQPTPATVAARRQQPQTNNNINNNPARIQVHNRGTSGSSSSNTTVIVVDEKIVNTGIMVVLVAIFVILAKKALCSEWLLGYLP